MNWLPMIARNMARYPGRGFMDWWEKEPMPVIQALADYIPILDASDALQGVSVAAVGSGRLKAKDHRAAIDGWQSVCGGRNGPTWASQRLPPRLRNTPISLWGWGFRCGFMRRRRL